jgi:hypothetical protein
MKRRASGARRGIGIKLTALAGVVAIAGAASAWAAGPTEKPPPIRLSDHNRMPACVTPARLMAYLRDRNPKLDARFSDIAKLYKTHGEAWRVRWDYAFFQMIIETNGLLYKTGSGRMGDVNPKQNNFAGIGTTGGGVPGDGYPDVSTGVLAQIQHLVAYSGERMESPVAPRTQLKQDDIIAVSARLKRTVTFGDLAGRWAVDRRYARSIQWVADRFNATHCNGRSPIPDEPEPVPAPRLVKTPMQISARHRTSTASVMPPPPVIATEAPVTAAAPAACKVRAASYVGRGGNRKTLLIEAKIDNEVHFTALQVLDGFERSMADTFIKSRAPGGTMVAEFDNNDAAMARAYELCPSAR